MKNVCLATSFLFTIIIPCFSDTIHVPTDQPTIQAGIDVAVNGDTVLVAPGRYEENLDFAGKAIHVLSLSGCEQTIVDGGNTLSVVKFHAEEETDTVLEGFTITNGYSATGGGISCIGASPTILHNRIILNTASADGGGIYCSAEADAHIIENVISTNRSTSGRGGGVFCDGSNSLVINNYIANNTLDGDRGAGIYVRYASPTISGNSIVGNHSDVRGGGIYCYEASPNVIGNTIKGNSAVFYGGGVYCYSNSHARIQCNMISDNTVTLYGGGGVICSGGSNAAIVNNTITRNEAGTVGGGIWNTSSPAIINNIVWNNRAPDDPQIYRPTTSATYCLIEGGWPGIGNIDANPIFIDDVNSDFHIAYQSPCKDSGSNNAITELYDFEGDPRIAHGTVDLGADEFHSHLYCTGDFTPSGSIEGKFIGIPATFPVGLFIGSGVLDPPMQHGWGDFYLQSPWLLFPLIPIPANGVLEIPASLPSTPAPYDIPMQALIGWELSNLFVLEVR